MGGRRINRSRWPSAGPHRQLLEHFDRVHVDNGCKSLRLIGQGVADFLAGDGTASRTTANIQPLAHSRVSAILTGKSLPADERQMIALVRALGGGSDEVRIGIARYNVANDNTSRSKGTRLEEDAVSSAIFEARLETYLRALIAEVQHLRPGSVIQDGADTPLVLALDDIFVGLEAVRDRPTVDQRVTLDELATVQLRVEGWEDDKEREQQRRIYAELYRAANYATKNIDRAHDVEQLIAENSQIVLLGDPGSGKTTLLRYVALRFAQDLLAGTKQFDNSLRETESLGSLGFPIYIRIADYTEARARHDSKMSLLDYLPHYVANTVSQDLRKDVLQLIYSMLDSDRSIVLLDGLDEVIDDHDRREVAAAIAHFSETVGRSHRSPTLSSNPRNRIVVTSRIAGYRPFVELPPTFNHFTIQPMSREKIEAFLNRWCVAVERCLVDVAVRISKYSPPTSSGPVAREEVARILAAIDEAPGVKRLAENPLLLRTLAILHRSSGGLPARRVELYEKATRKMLYDWHYERPSPKGVAIDQGEALRLLCPLAMHIHEHRPSGFLTPGETESLLSQFYSPQIGDESADPSPETVSAVRTFLKMVREHSGLFVERGTGLFGFMHLTFQEYFVARYLVSRRAHALQDILYRLHQPRWREPILLAVASLTDPYFGDVDEILKEILDAGSAYEALLHRDLLFVVDCISECTGVAPSTRRIVADRVIECYCDPHVSGRYALLQRQLKEAFASLHQGHHYWIVEAAAADYFERCRDKLSLARLLGLIDTVRARTPALTDALHQNPYAVMASNATIEIRSKISQAEDLTQHPSGWAEFANDRLIAQAMGALWLHGWRPLILDGLSAPIELILPDDTGAEAAPWTLVARLRELSNELKRSAGRSQVNAQTTITELREIVEQADNALRHNADWQGFSLSLRNVLSGKTAEPVTCGQLSKLLDQAVSYGPHHLLSRATPRASVVACALDLSSSLAALPQSFPAHDTSTTSFAIRRERLAIGACLKVLTPIRNQFTDRVDQLMADVQVEGAVDSVVAEISLLRHDIHSTWLDQVEIDLREIGGRILRNAQRAHSLGPAIAGAVRQSVFVTVPSGLDRLKGLASAAGTATINCVKEVLEQGTDSRQYLDALALLARSYPIQAEQPVVSLVEQLNANRGDTADRPAATLLALYEPSIRSLVRDTARLTDKLTDIATNVPGQSGIALDLLFTCDLTSELLDWCWIILTEDQYAELHDEIRERIGTVSAIRGSSSVLSSIRDGLCIERIEDVAVRLLPRVLWLGVESFVECIRWLGPSSPDAIFVTAGIMLAEHGRALCVPAEIAAEAARSELERTAATKNLSWASLIDNSAVRLLLEWLCVNRGWLNALTQVLLHTSAREFLQIRENHIPIGTQYAEVSVEYLVTSLLQHARFGQGLITLFVVTAEQYAQDRTPQFEELEGMLLDELTTLASRSEKLSLMEFDAEIILTGLRHERPILPAQGLIGEMLAHPSPAVWYPAAMILSPSTNSLPNVVESLLAKLRFGQADEQRLALLALTRNPELRAQCETQSLVQAIEGSADPELLALIAGTSFPSTWPNQLVVALPALGGATALTPDTRAIFSTPIEEVGAHLTSILPLTRIAAALRVLLLDLYERTLPPLLDATLSGPDHVRWLARRALYLMCSWMPTNGLTSAVDRLQRIEQHRWVDGFAEGTGPGSTAATHAVSCVSHSSPFWIETWIDLIERSKESPSVRLHAAQAIISSVSVSDAVVKFLGAKLAESTVDFTRLAIVHELSNIVNFRTSSSEGDPTIIGETLINALSDPDVNVRRVAAYGLQWALMDRVRIVAALGGSAGEDPDLTTRRYALISLGRYMRDWETVLSTPSDIILAGVTTANSGEGERSSPQPMLAPASLLKLFASFLSTDNAELSRAAAAGLAAMLESRDDVMDLLTTLFGDTASALTAIIEGSGDEDFWEEQGVDTADSHHVKVAATVGSWLAARPREERRRLVALLLSELERSCARSAALRPEDILLDGDQFWSYRRITMAVLAEVSERLTFKTFESGRPLASFVEFVARIGRDAESYSTRRFAVRILGNLQHFTPPVSAALFEACGDTFVVYREAMEAVRKFSVFSAGCLPILCSGLSGDNVGPLIASHSATLLGILGMNRSRDLGQIEKNQIVTQMVGALAHKNSKRTVRAISQDEREVVTLGPLYDVIFEALAGVLAGQESSPGLQFESAHLVWRRSFEPPADEAVERAIFPPTPRDESAEELWNQVTSDIDYAHRCFVSIPIPSESIRGISQSAENGYIRVIIDTGGSVLEFDERKASITVAVQPPEAPPQLDGSESELDELNQLGPISSSDNLVVAISEAAVDSPSYSYSNGYLHLAFRPRIEDLDATAYDVVFGRENTATVSIPYWEGAVGRVSYTLEDTVLNIIFTHEDGEPIKLSKDDVRLSRGCPTPLISHDQVRRARRRRGRRVEALVVSLPCADIHTERVTYLLKDNGLHILIVPRDRGLSVRLAEASVHWKHAPSASSRTGASEPVGDA